MPDKGKLSVEKVIINASCSECVGSIRRLNGINNGPPVFFNRYPHKNLVEQMKALRIPMIRFHDASLVDKGIQLVDVSRIFPLFHADSDDPKNYLFAETDDYISQCIATGAAIEYRLGESIEHTLRQYRVHPPADFEKWADICCHIICHYNEGWANGFHYNIEDWSIWEEPDTAPILWTGTRQQYYELYAITAKRIRKEFPKLRVGGPQECFGVPKLEEFVGYCRQHRLPLDYLAFTVYSRDPESLGSMIESAKGVLDRNGYTGTRIRIAEWHYAPRSWAIQRDNSEDTLRVMEEMKGINSAVFASYALSLFQDTTLDMGFFYMTFGFCWGIFDERHLPNKNYYAFKAFADIADCPGRIEVPAHPHPAVRVLGGKTEDGRMIFLISCFKSSNMDLEIDTGGDDWKDFRVQVLDETHNLTEGNEEITKAHNKLTIRKDMPGSALYLVTLV
jgi:hypothetical protein